MFNANSKKYLNSAKPFHVRSLGEQQTKLNISMSTRSMELTDTEIGTEIEIDTNIETTANI